MVASVNGWRVIGRKDCTDVKLPGGVLPVHPEFAWLFWDLGNLWHERVEPLVWPGCWGWAEQRPIRGGTVTTNHASGTAADLCAPLHPRGVPIGRTFSPAQLGAIADLEHRYFGVLRWGGRWSGKEVDGMHWEAIPGVDVAAVRRLTSLLRDHPPVEVHAPGPRPAPVHIPAPVPVPAPAPVPAPVRPVGGGWTGPDLTGTGLGLRGEEGHNGARTRALQDWLRRTYPAYAKHLDIDGWWGEQTTGVVRQFGLRSGVRSADGENVGPQLARKLYLAGFRG